MVASAGETRAASAAVTSIQHVVDLYVFDRKLRVSAIDALERIEVATRAALSNAISAEHGAHWFMNSALFIPTFDHAKFLSGIQEDLHFENKQGGGVYGFIRHYFSKYSAPDMPPCWMVFETLSFTAISRMYAVLLRKEQKKVADLFGIAPSVLQSWLHSLSYLRNLCAHHARLWNRTFTIKPMIASSYGELLEENDKFYAQAVVMQVFLRKIASGSLWPERLAQLFGKHPNVDITMMGFPKKWQDNFLWK